MTENDKLLRYGPIVARCRSSRDPDVTYEVRRHPEQGTYSCNCRSWATSPSSAKACKHTKAAVATEGRSGIVELGRDGRQLVMRRPSSQDDGILRGALGELRGQVRDAVQREAQKALAAAGRPILLIRQAPTTVPIQQRRRARGRAIDPIRAEAVALAATLSSWGPLPVTVDRIVELVDAAIRKFAGDKPAPALAAQLPAERGVREIILDD